MKQIKVFSMMLLLATMFVSFNACSSDDDDKKEENNLIVGKWKVMEYGYTHEVMQYKANSTFEYFYDDYSETGKYKIESGKLYLMWDEDDVKDWEIYKIHELNSISLILEEYDEKGNLDGYKESYQRIK